MGQVKIFIRRNHDAAQHRVDGGDSAARFAVEYFSGFEFFLLLTPPHRHYPQGATRHKSLGGFLANQGDDKQ